MKKSFLLLAALALFLLTLISCNEKNPVTDAPSKTDAPVTSTLPVINGTDISDYKIIRNDSANAVVKQFYARIRESIEKSAGVKLAAGTDFAKTDADIDNDACEILIGNTNRAASVLALAELESNANANYLIKFTGNKIVIVGKDDMGLVMGVKAFESRVVEKSAEKGILPIKDGYKYSGYETYDYLFENGVTLKQEYTREISEKSANQFTYPTLIVLGHNGDSNGTMFATYHGSDLTIMKSENDGKAWTKASKITLAKAKCGFSPYWNPCLFELPADIGKYKEGTILYACTSVNEANDNFTKSAISIFASTDLCQSWQAVSDVALGGSLREDTGVWEPSLLYDDAKGRLYCFYSDDSDPSHSQKLVCKWTDDLVTWSEAIDNVTLDDEHMRPGMTSAVKMNNGEYYICYEVGLNEKEENYPVHYKTTKDLDTWDYKSVGTLIESENKGVTYSGAPWCAYSPLGGDCGTLFVIGCWQMTGGPCPTGFEMCISFDYGKTYESIPNFINMYDASGYSPCLFFTDDGGTLYYVNCPKAESGKYVVTMTKVTLKK